MDASTNIPQIYTSIAELMACMVYILGFPDKRKWWQIGGFAVLIGVSQAIVQRLMEGALQINWVILSPVYICVLFGLMVLFLRLSVKASWKNVLYFSVKAFILAEFVASFEWQVAYYLHWTETLGAVVQFILMLLIDSVLCGVVWVLERHLHQNFAGREASTQEIYIAVLITAVIFILSNLSFFISDSPFAGGELSYLFNLRTIFDLMGLIILYAFESRIAEVELKNEIASMDRVLRNQYDKYRNYQDNIELINMKYHDLKHQLEDLQDSAENAGNQVLLQQIREELDTYSPMLETGNQVLNALLDSRQIICQKKHIALVAVSDGQLLDFMHVADLCSLIGNALDNAIESVIGIEEEERRLIRLEITSQKNFVMISIENSCDHPVIMQNGIPQTTKEDKSGHGYGTKSIVQIAEKYGGNAFFELKDNWFTMQVIIPQ